MLRHKRISANREGSRLRPEEPMADRDLSGRMLGEFVLRQQIGQGGYGAVYRSEQPLLNRDVVVKVLRRNDASAEERFLREAQLASLFNHPYAAHIYAFGVEEGTEDDSGLLWIAMELVEGTTLDDWLEKRGPMSLEQFVPFFESVAEVVQAAHERGVVHRDLKPSNVMVIDGGPRLFPKLLDFGIAKLSQDAHSVSSVEDHDGTDARSAKSEQTAPIRTRPRRKTKTNPNPVLVRSQLTGTDVGMGSCPYMSPEQWRNASAVGPATDIYSLGIVAYEALTRRVPFTAHNTDEYRRQHCEAEVPQLGCGFSPDVDRVIRRALAKQPADRQGSVVELASDLRAALRAQPREQLRASAQQWEDRSRAPGLLWGRDVLVDVDQWAKEGASDTLSELECSFVAASQRRARRIRWAKRALALFAAIGVFGVLQYRAATRTWLDEQVATESAIEQGRQALLHGETQDAVRSLERAYQRGADSPGVKFMLARALQPRMSEIGRFQSSSGRMWSAMFAPDNKRILTTDDKNARMWDAESHQLLFSMPHGDIVYQAVFSPDGAMIITAGGDGIVRIWNAATGERVRELRYQGTSAVQWRYYAVAMSSRSIAAIDLTGKAAHVWNVDTGTQTAELENDGSELAMLAFSADGRWLATSGGDEVRVFDTLTWQRAVTIAGPRVRSLVFDPTGLRLAVGTYDGVASVWEIPSGLRVRCLREAGESVDAIAFSRDGSLIATASRDGAEQVWDVSSGGLRTQFNSHRAKIYAVEFSTKGDMLLSAGADGAVVVANVATGMPVARLEGPDSFVFAAHFDQDSRRVVGASWDGTARVWDATSPYQRWSSPAIGPECDTMDSLVPDQRFIALSCRKHGTRVWDSARGEVVADLPEVTAVDRGFYSALPALTVNGDRAAIARGDTVQVYALPSGQLLRTITHPSAVNAVAFAPAGHDLVTGAIDGSLLITRDERDPIALPMASDGIDAAALLADGRIVSADASGRLRVIDPSRNAVLMNLAAPYRVRLLRSSPDGRRLITISTRIQQAAPTLWELEEKRLVAHLEGHVGRVFGARFVSNGREILTAGADGTAQLWDTVTGKLLQRFHHDSRPLVDAALAPDGSVVVAGSADGYLRFWDVLTGRLLWMLQTHKSYVVGVHYENGDIITRGFAGDVSRWALANPDRVIDACHANACALTSPARE